MSEIEFIDLWERKKSNNISLIFPDWNSEDERIVFFSPHDDDAILGAGYLILAAQLYRAKIYIVIFCNGSAGYTTPEHKNDIVKIREKESLNAYKNLGIPEERIIRLNYDDFSIDFYTGRYMPDGNEGTFHRVISLLREIKTTRLILPNSYREHIDHLAVYKIGAFDGPQAGDSILADMSTPVRIRSYLQYSVWGDFSAEEALTSGVQPNVKANYAVLVSENYEKQIHNSILQFVSQSKIIESIIEQRKKRKIENKFMELYLKFNPRPKLEYSIYKNIISKLK